VTDPQDFDSQDVAESLDSDKIDDAQDYGEELLADYPPDEPQGVDRMAITPAEEAFPESPAERDNRTLPDPLVEELDERAEERGREQGVAPPNRIVGSEPHGDEEDLRLEATEVPAEGQWAEGEQVERLVATAPVEADDEGTMVAAEVPTLRDLSAEEAAMRPTGAPPYHDRDSYLDERSEQ
jgi:hypothetical protein